LISEIGQKSKLLDAAVQELGKRGRSYAQSEQEYRIALAKRILDERSKGTPVTIISDICRGDREIANCPACHRAYDEGTNIQRLGRGTTRESLYCYLVAYLKGFYPDWNREDMIYHKGVENAE